MSVNQANKAANNEGLQAWQNTMSQMESEWERDVCQEDPIQTTRRQRVIREEQLDLFGQQ